EGYDVITYLANIGQEEDFDAAKKNVERLRAKKVNIYVFIEDLMAEFVEEFIWPSVQANAIYEDCYLLGTSVARPCIARHQVQRKVRGQSTRRGNDQIRFELTCHALYPEVKIIAPWRIPEFYNRFRGRKALMEYAEKHDFPVPVNPKAPWSMDANLMHISIPLIVCFNCYKSGILENPKADTVTDCLTFIPTHTGVPVKEGKSKDTPLDIFSYLNNIRGRHGVGRIDIVESRNILMPTTLRLLAHSPPISTGIQTGNRQPFTLSNILFLFSLLSPDFPGPECKFVQHCIDKSQESVEGKVQLSVFKGQSPKSLYNEELVSMDVQGDYKPCDVSGFIKINAVRLREHHRWQGEARSKH
uniref:Argininosuccinate synthase n=1 Tax=Hucho hucho TaxID=62062 RepID=A0A4W5K010_9TELE